MIPRVVVQARVPPALIAFLLLAALAASAQIREPELIFPALPKPLVLPPGNVQTLPLNKTASFFGGAYRAVDCEEPGDQELGLCSNVLFGGFVLTTSHLEGDLTIRFFPLSPSRARFTVAHGQMRGDDTILSAPQGYVLPVRKATVSDPPGRITEGELDLLTGAVTKLRVGVLFSDTALKALSQVNPNLQSPVVEFPGARGRAWARFEQREDGLLDYSFSGSAFLPLGGYAGADPIRFPLPFCDAQLNCASILARGTTLRPRLSLSTRAPDGEPCAPNCPQIPSNTAREFIVNSQASSFGDDFRLDIPALGGGADGRSHVQGRLLIQFGVESGGTVPFVVRSLPPAALLADPPASPLLGRAFAPGLLGAEESLRFPNATYRLEKVVFVDEAFNIPQGEIDLRTGRVLGEMAWPSYFGQTLAEKLFDLNAGVISREPFDIVAARTAANAPNYALFEKAPDGALVFRYSGEHVRSFAGFLFPSPDYLPANALKAGPAAQLNLFLRLQASLPPGAQQEVMNAAPVTVTTSLGDRVTYSYTIPCDGASVRPAFQYANANAGRSGGTFRLTRLASVRCTNSRGSLLPEGQSDTVTFSAFGTWSKDESGALPRMATVQVSTAARAPYMTVTVFQQPDSNGNVVLSSANTRPSDKPLP